MPIIDGVELHPLKEISVSGGNVLHAMNKFDKGYKGFGEAYFSFIEPDKIKAWKRHKKMTLNLIVPLGSIRFVIFDDRYLSSTANNFYDIKLSRENYFRLTIPPMVWFGFQSLSKDSSMLLNLADIKHSPNEVDKELIENIKFNWDIT